MRHARLTCIGIAILAVCSCKNSGLSTSRIESKPVSYTDYVKTNSGKIYYALRKSEFSVEIPFVVIRDVPYKRGDPTKPAEIDPDTPSRYWLALDSRPEKKASVTASFQADPELMFAIETEKSESAWTNTKELKVALDEKSMLTSVNGDFEDKKGEVIKNVLSTALNIAKFSSGIALKGNKNDAIVYKPKLLEKHTQVLRVRVTADDLKKRAVIAKGNLEATMDLSVERAAVLARAAKAIRQDNVEGATDATVSLDPTAEGAVKLKLVMTGSRPPTSKSIRSDLSGLLNQRGALDGVVVQKVRSGTLILVMGDEEVARGEVSVSDFAGPTVIPIQGKSFANNKRSISFNSNGGVKEYTASSSSQAESVSGLISTESAGVMKASREIESGQESEVKLLAARAIAIQAIDLEILKKKNEIDAVVRQIVTATETTTPKKSELEGSLEVKNLELNNLEEKRRLTSMGLL